MNTKLVWLLMAVGGAVGGYVPLLWGGSTFSMSSILFTALGGFLGIYVGYKLSE